MMLFTPSTSSLPLSGRWALPLVSLLACTQAAAQVIPQAAWVQGSWVNLRSAPATSASVKSQLTTNTALQVTAKDGDWCAVRVASPATDGYVNCSLLGNEPLTLAKAKDQPGRAFWVAPSVQRLVAYGALLRAGPAYKRMYEKLQDGEVARIAPLPEFDAAKRLMAAGITPAAETEVNRGNAIPNAEMAYAHLIKPTPIKPSLFRTHSDVLTMAEANADSLAAVAKSKITVKPTVAPTGYVMRHEGPEISGISGFGDIGDMELHFSPHILVYYLLPNGLLSAATLSKQTVAGTPEYGATCGITFNNGGVGSPVGIGSADLTVQPVRDFARVPESMMPMAAFVTAKPLSVRKLSIKSRAARLSTGELFKTDPQWKDQTPPSQLLTLTAKVVLHEVDIDGDRVPDMLIWDLPSLGSMSGAVNLSRAWYLNIGGQWYAAGTMYDQECT